MVELTNYLSVSDPSLSTTTSSSGSELTRNESCQLSAVPTSGSFWYRSVAVLSGHVGSVSCLALCGEFVLSASRGKDIIVWQHPDFTHFTRFGHGDGSVKALVTAGSKVLTAHQDGRIRVWKVSRRSEKAFRLADTLPTTKDYLGKFMKKSNYVPTRRHHKRLWIEHADTISCLTVCNGLIYSGSWDKTLKVWRVSDLKCMESIKAHDDAINGLASSRGMVYSASADGKIKAWAREGKKSSHSLKATMEGHEDVSVNSVVVSEDGKWVYGGGSDGYVMCWESGSWKLASETRAHKMAVLCMSMNGEMLCSGSADKSIGIWRREGLGMVSKVGVIRGHQGPVKCLQASPVITDIHGAGFKLYSGSLDKTLRVWWVPINNNDNDNDNDNNSIKW